MKTKLFWLMAILSVISISCDKTSLGGDGPGNGGNDGPLPELSPLEEVDNVCDKMDDLKFMAYCYENFDVNKDGKVSMIEASAAESIACHDATSFAGLEYFNNLKSFSSTSVETVDFRYNSLLEYIYCEGSKVSTVDLRYNINLLSIPREAFRESSLTSIYLPESITIIGSLAFYDCSFLRKVDARNCDALSTIYGAFNSCSIEEFLLGAVNVPTLLYGEDSSGLSTSPFSKGNHILKVPAESVEAYKNSEWAKYFETIEAL